jgi:tetratricopeptide (TPR) repeat protein
MLHVLLMAGLMAVSNNGTLATLESARDKQDRDALTRLTAEAGASADKSPKDAEAQYRAALAASYQAEVSLELKDKKQAQQAAEQGIKFAERAIALAPNKAEYHRVLGTLCGQVVPANVLMGLSYGKRAKEAIAKAIEKDPKWSGSYVARGVGNYYLPASFGGGTQLAIADFRKALEFDPKNAEAYLWLGLSLRKEQKNADARKAFEQALKLNPDRIWVKQQLEKTPPQ